MKEVIFHFFPSARFLGLSLKILFHKNKEIKRMLSKKMTFSLMSLITLLAFAFVAGDAFAAKKPFEITIVGRTTATYAGLTGAEAGVTVDLIIESAHPIPELIKIDDPNAETVVGNVEVTAIDRNGFVLNEGTGLGEITDIGVTDVPGYSMRTAIKRQLRIVITQEADADDATKGAIARVVIEIPAGVETTDPTVLATDGTDTELNISKIVQHTITLSAGVDTTGLPKVVSIQRLRPGSQTVVSAFQEERIPAEPFNVRIVLTEHPNGPDPLNAANLVDVENGVPSNLVVGTLFARRANADGDANSTILPHPIEGMYTHSASNLDGLAGVAQGTGGDTDTVPLPTSDDNMYRQYRVTITPHEKSVDFDVKVRVKPFHDAGTVVRNTYLAPAFADSVHSCRTVAGS